MERPGLLEPELSADSYFPFQNSSPDEGNSRQMLVKAPPLSLTLYFGK